jgi:hypothetical protein
VTERGALLGAPVHRTQQGVDVDEDAVVDAVQHRGLVGERDQVPAQHRRQLPGVAVGELAQEDSQRGSGVDPAEQLLHPTGPHEVQVVDAVRAGGHPRDD